MIIMAPTKASCKARFAEYQRCLKAVRLPADPPKTVPKYVGKGRLKFWEGKSDAPYHWGPKVRRGDIPWTQFVG